MDLMNSCKEKVAYFRIKELKDVLTQLGFSKQGKKQDLVDRILSVLSDEQASKMWPKKNAVSMEVVAKLVDDTYRKMQISGATDLASKEQVISDSSHANVNGELDAPLHSDIKVRCPCGSSLTKDSTVQCKDPRCHVWQHIDCVIIPEKPMQGNLQHPDLFYCEICRLNRADPFWVTVAHPLYPVKLTTTNVPTDGSTPVQGVEKTFHLTRADKDLLMKQEYDVQAWCMLLNDKVLYRMQWPQYADLQVNGMPVRAINRPGSQLLGASGRDDGAIITQCAKDGINKIVLSGCDARIFCFGVRLVKRRTVLQILNLIHKESDGEPFEDALARVCRCVGGGHTTDDVDGDSDLEVVADSFAVSLRCPMSGSRIKVAGRFKLCAHMGCFDLEVFVELNERSRKWQCPVCLKNYSLEHIIIDPYFNRITSQMRHCGEDIREIEVKPDGSWRVKTKTEAECKDVGELAQWHNPDSTLCVPNVVEIKSTVEAKQIKQGVSEGHASTGLKLGMRKNSNGFWEVSKPLDLSDSSSGNRLLQNFENHEQKVVPMSSSATASGRDGEDPSVNHDGGGNFDFPNNGVELDSLSLNAFSTFENHNFSMPAGNEEVILLSDSDDDNDMLVSSGNAYKSEDTNNVGDIFSVPPSIMADPFPEVPTLGPAGDIFNPNHDQYDMSLWSLPPGNQPGPSFQLFSSDVSDVLADLPPGNMDCPSSMNGYTLTDTLAGPAGLVPDSSVAQSDLDIMDGLVDNPLAFGREDPSLQIFLPTMPSNASQHSDLRDAADASNGIHAEDWISLTLGGNATRNYGESVPTNGMETRQRMAPREASLLLGMNDDKSKRMSQPRSESPISFHRRSVRPRLYLSIDSDSD